MASKSKSIQYVTVFMAAALAAGAWARPAASETPDAAMMWQIIQQQQKKIEELEGRLEGTDRKVEQTQEAVEATATAVEEGIGGPGWWNKTSLGGYGELHYNGGDVDQIDFHRFVLLVGHEFSDDIRFNSEVELEHALVEDTSDGSGPGELELEQAYLEFDLDDNNRAQAGLWLVPVGILNPTHEPATFYGVERNPVETNIIPTTWWEGGVGFLGGFESGLGYHVGFHSGLKTPVTGSNAFKVRSGRQKVAKADAKDFAYTGQLSFTGIPGVEFAGTFQYQNDLTQGVDPTNATLGEVHVDASYQGFGFRALYARWDLDSDSGAAEALGRDEQDGWYVEPSYRFALADVGLGDVGDLGAFARFNQWNNEAGLDSDREFEQVDFGLNYWPHPDIVLKGDFQVDLPPPGTAKDNRFNLGLGYQF